MGVYLSDEFSKMKSLKYRRCCMNWKSRLRNKTFWVSLTAAIVLLAQQLGLDIFPENISDIVNTILLIATILGVIVDPSTDGIKDGQKEQIK